LYIHLNTNSLQPVIQLDMIILLVAFVARFAVRVGGFVGKIYRRLLGYEFESRVYAICFLVTFQFQLNYSFNSLVSWVGYDY